MSAPVLATKLFVPLPQPRTVPRARLIRRLNDGLAGRLTLVSAPAGFGKSTLVGEWAAQSDRQVAWLSLENGDGEPTRFLAYLIAALQTTSPGFADGLAIALGTPQPPPTDVILPALMNEIASIADDQILVLDDYHAVDAETIDAILSFMVDHLPAQLHLVVVTREDPALPLARLRARGQLTEVRAADLRFTTSEAAEFLNNSMGLSLSADDVAALENRTEGWIAGLQLAAISMQGREDATAFVRSFTGSHRFVLDYLVEEVLQRQPAHIREFLLQTSVLDRLSGPLCRAVTGQERATAMLEELERANLFVIPLDDRRNWFRYHHLFADVLQMRAAEEQPEDLALWHQRASQWYAENEMPTEAIRHAFAARDFERAATLAEEIAHDMLMSRQEEIFISWVKDLPDALVGKRPVLSAYFALALASFDLEAAEIPLRNAERYIAYLSGDPDVVQDDFDQFEIADERALRSLRGVVCITRAYKAGARGDVSGIVEYARQALEHLPEDEVIWRGAVASLLGLAQWTNGDLDEACRSIEEGIRLLRMSGEVTQSFSGSVIVANIRLAQGRLRDAQRTYEQALLLAEQSTETLTPPVVDLYVGISEVLRERNDLEAATRYLLETKEVSQHGGISEYRHRWYVAMALIRQAEGDLDQAFDLLDEAERRFVPSPDPVVRPIAALKARVWVQQGKLAEAEAWARRRNLSTDEEPSYLREFELMTLARLLIEQFRMYRSIASLHDALSFLERLREAAEQGERNGSLIEILSLQALAFDASGDEPRAIASLARALNLAEPEGYVRIFLDEGAPLAKLMARVNTSDVKSDYTSKLLTAFEADGIASDRRSSLMPEKPEQPLAEPLSQRELEVLHLIAQGLSNREISDRLFLALNTVKGHNRLIFSKLQVQRRTEAVARARELGLL